MYRGKILMNGFEVPLLAGDHVTDDAGTGFVHTAPGHGADDYNIWIATGRSRDSSPPGRICSRSKRCSMREAPPKPACE